MPGKSEQEFNTDLTIIRMNRHELITAITTGSREQLQEALYQHEMDKWTAGFNKLFAAVSAGKYKPYVENDLKETDLKELVEAVEIIRQTGNYGLLSTKALALIIEIELLPLENIT